MEGFAKSLVPTCGFVPFHCVGVFIVKSGGNDSGGVVCYKPWSMRNRCPAHISH